MPAPIQALVEQITPSVIHWRRDFHRYPELSNREEQTGMKLVAALKEMGIEELQYPIAQHGVTALIHGQGEGPCIALRADMDALPVEEQTGLPFASCHPGVMHACGHDCHMAVVLGAAFVLQQIKDTFPGTIKILFQPCEEGAPPGEIGGARLCIRDGVLQDPPVQTIFGLHINPLLECGRLSYYPGGYAAAVDQFEITVQGKQTHAAFPWEGRDPVVAAAAIVMAVQTLVSRLVDARDSAVLSIGKISGGSRWNIIPDTVTLTGTIRTHKPAVREAILHDFQHIVHHTAESHHTTATTSIINYGPVLQNEPDLARRMVPVLKQALGEEQVILDRPAMYGEDFAFYTEQIPGFYFTLGVHDPQQTERFMLHSPRLMVDERALPLGVRAMVALATGYLNQI